MGIVDPEDLLEEQLAYYRAGAREYHDGIRRLLEGGGGEWGRLVRTSQSQLVAAIDEFRPVGRVLEIAGGTGAFTRELVRHADQLTVLDASPESLAINRAELGRPATEVDWVEADVFDWTPDGDGYDVVFFAYWLSHVPPRRFEPFWALVRSALRPGGRAFLIDSTADATACRETRAGPVEGRHVERDLLDAGISLRRLDDGRRFRVVKVVHSPQQLVERLAGLGWSATAQQTVTGSIWASAVPRS